jgi:hypothetical protein
MIRSAHANLSWAVSGKSIYPPSQYQAPAQPSANTARAKPTLRNMFNRLALQYTRPQLGHQTQLLVSFLQAGHCISKILPDQCRASAAAVLSFHRVAAKDLASSEWMRTTFQQLLSFRGTVDWSVSAEQVSSGFCSFIAFSHRSFASSKFAARRSVSVRYLYDPYVGYLVELASIIHEQRHAPAAVI